MSTAKTAGGEKGTAKATKATGGVPVVADAEGKVSGVLVAEVKHELVDADLKKYGLPTTGSLPERISRLVSYYREKTPHGDLGDCNTCGGDSNVDEKVCPACPYCGTAGVVDAPKAPETATAPVATKPEAATGESPAPAQPASSKGAEKGAASGKLAQAGGEKAKDVAPSGKVFTVADLDAAEARRVV